MKIILYYFRKLMLRTFYKKKYYERSPSKAIVPYMEEELKKLAKYISEHSSIEKISAKNLKVERLEDIKEWNL
jgi:hypothetical protein